MASFFAFLEKRARERETLLCVGLDPRVDSVDQLRAECGRIIEATADLALAYKPNAAFFEAHGPEGLVALLDVIATIPDDIPVILDAKRGDIGETSEAYARAAFDVLGAHALTVSPYLGGDAVAPFLARPERGAFVLCKTSNPGADDVQTLQTAHGPLFERIARSAQQWNHHANVGLVVGATYPDALARVRAIAPQMWFLVPGIGAQGGDLVATLKAGLRADGLGLAITASRSIARARNPRAEAQRLRDEINAQRQKSKVQYPMSNAQNPKSAMGNLAAALLDSGCVKFGQFTLKSGKQSPIYLDLRRLITYPDLLRVAAQMYAEVLNRLKFDRIAGLPYAALPIGTAIALEMNRPLIYPRREVKDYGTKAAIEGVYQSGETVVVIDDLATTGDTKIESIQKFEAAGLRVRDVVVLIDREQGAKAILAEAGYAFHAVATLRALLTEWKNSAAITATQFDEVLKFLAAG
jgi:uridine monophosphate synthetase